MNGDKLAEAVKWLGRRIGTGGLYILATIGGSSWDRDPDSWRLIAFHLISAAVFLSWAVRRTVTHWHEDQEDA